MSRKRRHRQRYSERDWQQRDQEPLLDDVEGSWDDLDDDWDDDESWDEPEGFWRDAGDDSDSVEQLRAGSRRGIDRDWES